MIQASRNGRIVVAVAAAVIGTFGLPPLTQAQQRTLTIADLYDPARRIDFNRTALGTLSWLDSGTYMSRRISVDPFESPLARVDAITGDRTPLIDVSRFEAAIREMPDLTATDARELARRTNHVVNTARSALVFDYVDDLYHYDVRTHEIRRLTRTPATKEEASFSPDGRLIAFIQDHNLVVVDVEQRSTRALTTDGAPRIRNGLLNWVYQEEIYGRGNFRGYWWSPDSSRIAYLHLDDREVPIFPVVDHLPYHPNVEEWEYPKAGDPNPLVRLGVVSAVGGQTTWVELDEYRAADPLVVNVGWTPDSRNLTFQVQNREQNWLDLNLADPSDGTSHRILRESSETWVNALGSPLWLDDGTALWRSERTGWSHLYHIDRSGKVLHEVTRGPWEVRTVHGVDQRGVVYFSGTERSAIGLDIYRIGLDGTGMRRLSETVGTHTARFNNTLTHYVDTWSDISTPPQVRVHDANGGLVRIVSENDIPQLSEYELPTPEFLQVSNRDGFVMEALMVKPPNFDASRQYPVYQHVYGGPHVQRVSNAWSRETLYWQLLAQHGIVVWVLDNSTASGKGAVSTWPVYQRFGELELSDLEDGLDWLTDQSYVDADRIGIEGWSYGGYMVSYALTHSTRWSMGIAGGSVTDWRDYDSIYTERYMRMPQHNTDGYRLSSPRFSAADLHGALLLIHGSMDENVHLQNTLQFAYTLQDAGKSFDMMIYPKSRHRLGTPNLEHHRRAKMLDFVLEHLAPSGSDGAAADHFP